MVVLASLKLLMFRSASMWYTFCKSKTKCVSCFCTSTSTAAVQHDCITPSCSHQRITTRCRCRCNGCGRTCASSCHLLHWRLTSCWISSRPRRGGSQQPAASHHGLLLLSVSRGAPTPCRCTTRFTPRRTTCELQCKRRLTSTGVTATYLCGLAVLAAVSIKQAFCLGVDYFMTSLQLCTVQLGLQQGYCCTTVTGRWHADPSLLLPHIRREDVPGDILIFLTGQDECEAAVRLLDEEARQLARSRYRDKLLPMALFAGLPAAQQRPVFLPTARGYRKVVAATNVAETSLTIEGGSARMHT